MSKILNYAELTLPKFSDSNTSLACSYHQLWLFTHPSKIHKDKYDLSDLSPNAVGSQAQPFDPINLNVDTFSQIQNEEVVDRETNVWPSKFVLTMADVTITWNSQLVRVLSRDPNLYGKSTKMRVTGKWKQIG